MSEPQTSAGRVAATWQRDTLAHASCAPRNPSGDAGRCSPLTSALRCLSDLIVERDRASEKRAPAKSKQRGPMITTATRTASTCDRAACDAPSPRQPAAGSKSQTHRSRRRGREPNCTRRAQADLSKRKRQRTFQQRLSGKRQFWMRSFSSLQKRQHVVQARRVGEASR